MTEAAPLTPAELALLAAVDAYVEALRLADHVPTATNVNAAHEARRLIASARAKPSHVGVEEAWQPIATIPTDGEHTLVSAPHWRGYTVVKYHNEGHRDRDLRMWVNGPTLWMRQAGDYFADIGKCANPADCPGKKLPTGYTYFGEIEAPPRPDPIAQAVASERLRIVKALEGESSDSGTPDYDCGFDVAIRRAIQIVKGEGHE